MLFLANSAPLGRTTGAHLEVPKATGKLSLERGYHVRIGDLGG